MSDSTVTTDQPVTDQPVTDQPDQKTCPYCHVPVRLMDGAINGITPLNLLTRTQDEILARYRERHPKAPCAISYESASLLRALDYDHARPVIAEGYSPWAWEDVRISAADIAAAAVAGLDIPGIPLYATQMFKAWKWLLGHSDQEAFEAMQPDEAVPYIKNQIRSGEWHDLTRAAACSAGLGCAFCLGLSPGE